MQQLAVTHAETQEELERAQLAEVQSDVDYKQDELVHAAMVAVAAATNLTPSMVLQYIDRKNSPASSWKRRKPKPRPGCNRYCRRQRGTMRSPVDGVVLDRW